MGASLTFIKIDGDNQTLVKLPELLDVSMTYSNALAVVSALGFHFSTEECISETLTPQDLWAACELYLNSEISEVIDHGTETVVSGGGDCATLVECGRRPGYITMRVEAIRDAAKWAMLNSTAKFCYFA